MAGRLPRRKCRRTDHVGRTDSRGAVWNDPDIAERDFGNSFGMVCQSSRPGNPPELLRDPSEVACFSSNWRVITTVSHLKNRWPKSPRSSANRWPKRKDWTPPSGRTLRCWFMENKWQHQPTHCHQPKGASPGYVTQNGPCNTIPVSTAAGAVRLIGNRGWRRTADWIDAPRSAEGR